MVKENNLLREAVERLIKKLHVKVVILYGSRARGDWGPWSDYDLLIIGDFRERYLDRINKILETIADIPLPIEPHPYTLNEALKMLRHGNPLIIDALEEGKILYSSRRGELGVLRKKLKDLKDRGLRRSKFSIVLPSETAKYFDKH